MYGRARLNRLKRAKRPGTQDEPVVADARVSSSGRYGTAAGAVLMRDAGRHRQNQKNDVCGSGDRVSGAEGVRQ